MQLFSQAFRDNLQQTVRELPQAILIEGVNGYGAGYEARELARTIAKNNNAVVQAIEKPADKTVIGIDQIQALYRHTRAKQTTSRYIWIIEHAQLLSEEAQDAFLKLLEEPPAAVIFILAVGRVESLLTTIRSRCRIIRSSPVEAGAAEIFLEERAVASQLQPQLLFLADGSPTELQHLVSDESYRSVQLQRAAQAKALVAGGAFEQIALCAKLATNREQALTVIALGLRMLMTLSSRQAGQSRYTAQLHALSHAYEQIMNNGNVRLQLLRAVT